MENGHGDMTADDLRDRIAAAAARDDVGDSRGAKAQARLTELVASQVEWIENADDEALDDLVNEAPALIIDAITRVQKVVQAAARRGIIDPAGANELLRDTMTATQLSIALAAQRDAIDPDLVARLVVEGPEAVYASEGEEEGEGNDE